MKIYFTGLGDPRHERLEFVAKFKKIAHNYGYSYLIANEAQNADVILLLWGLHFENPMTDRDRQFIQDRSEDLFGLAGMDHPLYYFPGIYANVKKSDYNPQRIRSYCFIDDNQFVEQAYNENLDRIYYYSFTGGNNCRFRRRLFAMTGRRKDCLIKDTSFHKEWDPNVGNWEQSKKDYAGIIARSKFVLCPKGSGVATMRLFETMRSGGVPVLISDNYKLPEGPAWDKILVRIQEQDIDKLDEILAGYEYRWSEMSQEARKQWEDWFSPQVWIPKIADKILQISQSRKNSERKWRIGNWPLLKLKKMIRFLPLWLRKSILSR